MKITDPEARIYPVPAGELETSLWAGMSGAAVVTTENFLIGVVRTHALPEGPRSLTVTPLEAINRLPENVASRLWRALGVTENPTEWPRLPLTVTTVDGEEVNLGPTVSRNIEINEASQSTITINIATERGISPISTSGSIDEVGARAALNGLAAALSTLTNLLAQAGRLDEAILKGEEVVEIYQRLVEKGVL